MDKVKFGNTDLLVSRLCFGTLTMGPLQKKLKISEGAKLLSYAYEKGINFIDTAELYNTYPYIKESINISGFRPIICTKSYAYDKKTAKFSLEKALNEMNIDYIDIFLLHEQESDLTIKGHYEAIEYFLKAKQEGFIKHFGISTHFVSGVLAALKYKEIEVIHPIFNFKGIGIVDGDIKSMYDAIKLAYNNGKGIFAMKALGGGNLLKDYHEALSFILSCKEIHSVAIGMQDFSEIDMNIEVFNNGVKNINQEKLNSIIKNKKLHIEEWCSLCGECVKHCHQNALIIENNKLKIEYDKCLTCGYCSTYCKNMAIKII
ncbi:aldo/keto reductase [Caldicellulosiruptoraceae bacterium PP1]